MDRIIMAKKLVTSAKKLMKIAESTPPKGYSKLENSDGYYKEVPGGGRKYWYPDTGHTLERKPPKSRLKKLVDKLNIKKQMEDWLVKKIDDWSEKGENYAEKKVKEWTKNFQEGVTPSMMPKEASQVLLRVAQRILNPEMSREERIAKSLSNSIVNKIKEINNE